MIYIEDENKKVEIIENIYRTVFRVIFKVTILMIFKYIYLYCAEREGFEPPEVLPSTVFKTAAIDHSAISPLQN